MDQVNPYFYTYIWHIFFLAKSKSPPLFLEAYQIQSNNNYFKSVRRNLAERNLDLYFAGYIYIWIWHGMGGSSLQKILSRYIYA